MDIEKNQNIINKILLKMQYFFDSMKVFNRYPYILDGEIRNHNATQTILIYRVRGKRDIFELSAQDICNNPGLISNFHPLDVRIIAYISGLEQALEITPEQRKDRFLFVKDKIFGNKK